MTVVPGSLPVGDTGEDLDTTIVETSEGLVHREGVFIGDPADPDARANVVKNIQSEQYAVLVKDDNAKSIIQALGNIFEQNERILMMLESIAE